jgi:SagB-type dehydrogenase family enzyme
VTVRYRRSPFLVGYWRGTRLLAYNYASSRVIQIRPELWSALDACTTWRSVDELSSLLGVKTLRARHFIRVLLAHGFLQRSDRAPDAGDVAMAALENWNPAAGFFHAVTRQVRFLSPAAAKRMTARRARERPMPPPVKRLTGAPVVSLSAPELTGDFPDVLLNRRTWRRFGKGPVAQVDLATTLALSFGVQQWVPTQFGRLPLKTSPSGGARHPIEAYVCVRQVTGIRPGLYHYAADVHQLERIRGGDMTARLRTWMPHSGYFAKAAFVVVLTAVLERQVWRYPYARAYRAALAEAGHVCQTFCLAATWRGLAPFCLMGLDDARIEEDLGVDGVRETVLYVAGAGLRPRGSTWAPRARGTLRSRPNPVFRPS